jgi:esterase
LDVGGPPSCHQSDSPIDPAAVDLSFSETGTGKPLVILHGLFGNKPNWSSIAAGLGRSRRVISADLRNHGTSPWGDEHDYPSMAADVVQLIRRSIGGPADLLGHSMGGKVAMVVALEQPDLIDRLVVIDIAPARSTATSIDVLRAMRAVSLADCSRRSDVEAALAPAMPDRGLRAFLVQNVVTRPEGLAWTVNLPALERHFDAILDFPSQPPGRVFDKPTLFIAGAKSEYIQDRHQPEIARLFPAATIEVIDGAGHWPHAEAPDLFLDAVCRFLDAH